jgi:hypothetical protein
MTALYVPGTSLEIPGLEATLEYGDASKVVNDRIPDAMLINDHSSLERARITQLDGLHDDPEGSESRQPSADRHGEQSGNLLYRGRTIGLTGRAEAGNIGAMRNVWRRLRRQFRTVERDLLVHHPFEVPALVNEWINPLVGDDYGWNDPSSTGGGSPSLVTSVADGVSNVGSATLTGATGAGSLRIWGAPFDIDQIPLQPWMRSWEGQDVWLFMRVKVQAATGTVTSVGAGLARWFEVGADEYATNIPTALASAASPSTGTWYTVAVRVLASALEFDTQYVTPGIVLSFSGAGTYTVRFSHACLVFVDPDDPTPSAYVGGDQDGFEYLGATGRSASIGPIYAVNKILDPRFEDLSDSVLRTLSKWTSSTASLTIDQPPVKSSRWSGESVEGSVYFKATKDNTATSRVMDLIALCSTNIYARVIESRRYRWSARVNLLTKPATGNVVAQIHWLNQAGTVISTSSSSAIPLGIADTSVEATAPSGTVAATVTIGNPTVTTALAVLELAVSAPCFIDVTDWDPGDFYGVGDPTEEVDVYRRIPRPFLLRGVRKTSDMKAPEQQTRSRAWRDFSFSLRASDPRIYTLDRRLRALKLIGSPQLVSVDMAPLVALGVNPSTPPTGFTAEGQSGTASWRYGVQSIFGNVRPMMSIGDIQQLFGDVPAAPIIQRAYRSLEAYTYTNPLITIQGHFQMRWLWAGSLGTFPAFGYGAGGVSYNAFGAIIKRVSSSQWLELRVNSSSNDVFGSYHASAPYTVELWSSHNTSGGAAATRLAQWDLIQTSPFPNPINGPATVKCSIGTDNVVRIDITYVDAGATIVSLSSSYTLPSALITLFGSSVAGHVGEYIRSDNWANATSTGDGSLKTGWIGIAHDVGFPWISYFSVQKQDVLFPSIDCPVIGDVDTPQMIELRGGAIDPIITLTSTSEDGEPMISTMRLVGTVAEDNPVFVDVGGGKIYDSAGANRYSMLNSGSLHRFQPGHNHLQVAATDWGAHPAHAYASWRDALS